MGYTIKQNTKIAIKEEVTEGTYQVPASAADYISPLSDGVSIEPSKELLQRNNLTASIGLPTPRTGMKSVAVNIPVEMKASDVAGSAPEYGLLVEAALGATRSVGTTTTSASNSDHTATKIRLSSLADAQKYSVGDIVLVKESGAYHVSPVVAVDDAYATGAYTDGYGITLLAPKATGVFSNGVVIEKLTTYHTANSGHPSLSVTKFVEDAVRETAVGCKVTSMALNNFTTGQLPSFAFALEGLSFDRSVTATGLYTPDFDDSLPPITLNACVWVDDEKLDVNNLAFTVSNTQGFVTSTCSSNGKISSRITAREITGTLNPYKPDDNVDNFDRFNDNTEFSLFAWSGNPTGVAGEYSQICAFYMPKCLVTQIAEADQDGVLQDTLTFQAARGADGNTEELYVGFV